MVRYRAWIASLPVFERDKPYLRACGRWLSPNEALREMELGTDCGKTLLRSEELLMRRG